MAWTLLRIHKHPRSHTWWIFLAFKKQKAGSRTSRTKMKSSAEAPRFTMTWWLRIYTDKYWENIWTAEDQYSWAPGASIHRWSLPTSRFIKLTSQDQEFVLSVSLKRNPHAWNRWLRFKNKRKALLYNADRNYKQSKQDNKTLVADTGKKTKTKTKKGIRYNYWHPNHTPEKLIYNVANNGPEIAPCGTPVPP